MTGKILANAMAVLIFSMIAPPVFSETVDSDGFSGFYRNGGKGDDRARYVTVIPAEAGKFWVFNNSFLFRATARRDNGRLVFTPLCRDAMVIPGTQERFMPENLVVDPSTAAHGGKHAQLYRWADERQEFLSYNDIMLTAIVFSECVKKSRDKLYKSIEAPEYTYSDARRELKLPDTVNRHLLSVYSGLDYFTTRNPDAPARYRDYCAVLKSSGFGPSATLPWLAAEDDEIIHFVNRCIKARFEKRIVMDKLLVAGIDTKGQRFDGVLYPDVRMLLSGFDEASVLPGTAPRRDYLVIPAHISGVSPALRGGTGSLQDVQRLYNNYADLYLFVHREKGIVALMSVGYMSADIFIRKDLDFSDNSVVPLIGGTLFEK
jgi:hypothetical protein